MGQEFFNVGSSGATNLTRPIEFGDGAPASVAYLSHVSGTGTVGDPMTLKGNLLVRSTANNINSGSLTLAGNITQVGCEISDSAREEINAKGLHIFPGLIDAHVHFKEPGRTEWEGKIIAKSRFSMGNLVPTKAPKPPVNRRRDHRVFPAEQTGRVR